MSDPAEEFREITKRIFEEYLGSLGFTALRPLLGFIGDLVIASAPDGREPHPPTLARVDGERPLWKEGGWGFSSGLRNTTQSSLDIRLMAHLGESKESISVQDRDWAD